MICGYEGVFGHMLESVVNAFSWQESWEVDHQERSVKLIGSGLPERNEVMHVTLISEREKGTFQVLNGWANEVFPVYGPNKELVVSIERAAAPLFGIVTYGVQLLAYQQNPEGVSVWIARRAKTKRTFPSMLDSTVGGSLRTGESPFECLVRECAEEASFTKDQVKEYAIATGTINYIALTDERGGGVLGLLSPEIQFTYEMKIPKEIIPKLGDNEAESITLFTIDELKAALSKGEFTPANGCIVLDFFIRHGILIFESEKDYIEIASRLHRVHDFQTA